MNSRQLLWGKAGTLGAIELAFALGCSQREHPAYLVEAARTASAAASDDGMLLRTAAPISQTGGCNQVVELPVQRPNFYFVLDVSGSMNEIIPGTAGETRLSAARRSVVDMLRAVGSRVNYGITLFPQPSDVDACLPGKEVFPLTPGDEPTETGEDGPTLERFLSRVRSYSARGGTPTTDTLHEVAKRIKDAPGKTALFLLTDGAPNCNVDLLCEIERCIPNIEGALLNDGTRCDADLNCCAPGYFPDMCLDDEGAGNELDALRKLGVAAYVIGLPGASQYGAALSRMAERAGTARQGGGPGYFQVDDAQALAEALATLGRTVLADCRLELSIAPEKRGNVHVAADGRELEAGRDWEFNDDSNIELLGDACDDWKAGKIEQIHLQECRADLL